MSIDDPSGEVLMPRGFRQAQWRREFFAQIRTAELYRKVMKNLRDLWNAEGKPNVARDVERYIHGDASAGTDSPYFLALLHTAGELRLTYKGEPAPWAVLHLYEDVIGAFGFDHPHTGRTYKRIIEISISPGPDGIIATSDWRKVEQEAVEKARRAVADFRDSLASDPSPGYFGLDTHYSKREADRQIQIERLAIRLMNRAGMRNKPWRDRRLCADLELDVPTVK